MSWREVVTADLTDWLLEPSDPSVRFWALQDLKGREASDPDVEESQEELMGSGPVKAILSAQHPDGYWERHDDMYLPKYRASTHSLLILAELGAKRTPRIERAIEHMYKFQRDSGHFLTNLPKTSKGRASTVTDGCCLDGNVLYYLNHFGYLDDPRTRRLVDFLVANHSKVAGGWRCRAYPIDPNAVFPVNCYMGAMKPLKALAAIPEEKRPLEVRAVIEREVEKILENRIYLYRRNPDGSRKEKAGWKRFGFPLFYQSDVLEVLDTLTRLGVRDERMQGSVDLVLAAQQKDGRWLLKNTFNGKMWVDIEENHMPSKCHPQGSKGITKVLWRLGCSLRLERDNTWGRDNFLGMYPSLTVRYVEEPVTLREFIEGLGEDYLYAFDRRVVGVVVNDRRLWPSARLKLGDKVVVYPIIVGG